MKNTAIIGLLVLVVIGVLVPTYAEFASPLKQFNDRVEIDMINCNAEKILMISPRDKPVCVTSETSEKLLGRGYTMVMQSDKMSVKTGMESIISETNENYIIQTNENHTVKTNAANDDENLLSKEELRKITASNVNAKYFYETVITIDGLRKVTNPDGDWVPILDKDSFVEKITIAVDDKFTHITKSGSYATEKGFIKITDRPRIGENPFDNVIYYIHEEIHDEVDQIVFIDNFMGKMRYELGGSTPSDWIYNCYRDNNGYLPMCEENVQVRIWDDGYSRNGALYQFAQPFSLITFHFYPPAYLASGSAGIIIGFDGWTNHPELVETTIDPETAKERAYEFAAVSNALNRPLHDDGNCVLEMFEKDSKYGYVNRVVISGVPHYLVKLGNCTSPELEVDGSYFPLITVDAWTGDSIFILAVGHT